MSEMMHWLSPKVMELLQDQRVNCRKICSQTWTGHAEESEWRKSSALEPGFQCEWMRSNSTTLGLNQNSLSKMPFIYHHSVNTEERQTIFTPLTHLPMDSFIINPAFTSPPPLWWAEIPDHPLALLESSLKKFWATPAIVSSGSISRVAISLTWPFTFTMSLRMRCVITTPAVCLTLLQGSRNLTEARSYHRRQPSLSKPPRPLTAYPTSRFSVVSLHRYF